MASIFKLFKKGFFHGKGFLILPFMWLFVFPAFGVVDVSKERDKAMAAEREGNESVSGASFSKGKTLPEGKERNLSGKKESVKGNHKLSQRTENQLDEMVNMEEESEEADDDLLLVLSLSSDESTEEVEEIQSEKETPFIPGEAVRDIARRKKPEKTRFKKDQTFRLPVVEKEKKERKKKRLNLSEVRPPSTARIYYSQGTDEAELESLYNEEIDHLFKLIQKNKSPELLLRLGSLYVEKARFISFKLQGDYDKKMLEFEQGVRKIKPRLNLHSANVYNKKALKLFTDFIGRHPKHSRKDEVLFFLGFTSYQLGLEDAGSKHFDQLEKEFPKSIKLYEARFQLAEYYFRKSKWSTAYDYYKKVSRHRRGKFYFLSLYKMAWCSYKMAQTKRALNLLARVIQEGKVKENVASEIRGFTFVEEAIGDLAFFYSYSTKSPAEAPAFFYGLLGRKEALPKLKKLAYGYRDMGHISGVIHLFSHLIERDPTASLSFEYKFQIVQALYESNRVGQLFKHVEEWIRNYGFNSHWAKVNSDDKNLVKKSHHLMEVTLHDYALKNHHTFRLTKNNNSKKLALNFYRLYFSNFEKSKFSHEMHFFYGELLFETKNYRKAAFQYEQVIKKYPSSKYANPSYLNQLLARERMLPSSSQIDRMTRNKKTPVAFPESVKSFITAARRYLEKFPKQKNASTVLYRMAYFYYNFNRFDKAALYFRQIFDKYPSSSHISNVGAVLLELYNKNKDYKALEELAVKFATNKNTDKKLIEEAKYILQQLSFKEAQDLALKGKFKESAILYEKFARKNPSSTLASLAFFNAGINYEKHKDIKKAVAMYSSVLTYRDKKSLKMRNQANEFLPVLYEKLGFYRKAAKGYSSYAVNFPGSRKAVDYWYNAGVIYDAFNKVRSAVGAYNNYYGKSRASDRHEVLYLIGLLYERNRRWGEAVSYFDRYIKAPSSQSGDNLKKVRASFKIADIYQYRLKNKEKAKSWHRHTISLHKKLRAGTGYGARSHFVLAREAYDRFSAVKIPLQAAAQKKAVNRKIALLKQLEQELKPVIRYDEGEQIIASLALIGLANEKMAEAIYKAPLPRGLNRASQVKYKEGIKQVITPYVQAAVKSYNLALEKSGKLKIYSDWVEVASKGLQVIQLNKKGFVKFVRPPVAAEMMNIQILDETGTANFFGKLSKSFKFNISKEELDRITDALRRGKEQKMLQVISNVLNRDPDNILAINSLALFYLANNRSLVGGLIINRGLSKHSNQPALVNNLGVISLRNGDIRQAVSRFKKALSLDSSHLIARINLGNIFLKKKDYENAYLYLKGTYEKALSRWGRKDPKVLKILNNYGAALIGTKRWKSAMQVFDKLSDKPSPAKEIIFNRAIVLANGFKGRKFQEEAKGLVDELSFYSNSVRFNRKLNRLLAVIKK